MGRGFLGGSVWGIVVSVFGLALASLVVPLRTQTPAGDTANAPTAAETQPAAPADPAPATDAAPDTVAATDAETGAAEPDTAAETAVTAEAEPEASQPDGDAPESGSETAATPAAEPAPQDVAETDEPASPAPAPEAEPASPATEEATDIDVAVDETPKAEAPAPEPVAAALTEAPQALVAPPAGSDLTLPPAVDATDSDAADDMAPTDAPMPEAPSAPAADATPDSVTPPPVPEPSPSPAPAVAAQPEPEPAPEAAEAAQPDVEPAPQDPETDTTANATQGEAGVTIGRLPQIGVEPAEPAAEAAAPAQDGTPEAATAEPDLAVTPQADPDAPAWQRYAVAFDNPSGKPLFAVILIDDGEPGRDRAAIAALPFPLTIAIDPAAPEAGAIADSYRAAGKDVLLLTTGIPVGAQPQDVEQSMQVDLAALPTAVGVMDLPQGSFQNDPVLARQVMASLGETGLAVVVHDHGLPAAAREAVNAGLPAVTAFRTLDAAGESADTIRRYLDRAAFRAAQDGHVTVVGTLAAATLDGLTEWAGTGRSDSVAMAPVSAIFALQN